MRIENNKKALIVFYLIAIMVIAPIAVAQTIFNPDFKDLADGRYEGSYKKDEAKADVEVLIINGRIESITPIKHWYDGRRKVANTIGQRIVDKQQTRVDAVTAVTVTSVAVMKAVEDALEKAAAKAKEKVLKNVEENQE